MPRHNQSEVSEFVPFPTTPRLTGFIDPFFDLRTTASKFADSRSMTQTALPGGQENKEKILNHINSLLQDRPTRSFDGNGGRWDTNSRKYFKKKLYAAFVKSLELYASADTQVTFEDLVETNAFQGSRPGQWEHPSWLDFVTHSEAIVHNSLYGQPIAELGWYEGEVRQTKSEPGQNQVGCTVRDKALFWSGGPTSTETLVSALVWAEVQGGEAQESVREKVEAYITRLQGYTYTNAAERARRMRTVLGRLVAAQEVLDWTTEEMLDSDHFGHCAPGVLHMHDPQWLRFSANVAELQRVSRSVTDGHQHEYGEGIGQVPYEQTDLDREEEEQLLKAFTNNVW